MQAVTPILAKPVAEVVGVLSAVGDHCCSLAEMALKALACLGDISAVSRRKAKMHRLALAVANHMQLRIQPASGPADRAPGAGVF